MADSQQPLHDLGRRLMAEHYPHLAVDRLRIAQGDPVHTLWRVATPIGDVCLKRTSTPPEVLEFTTAAHEYMFRNGARVPELLPTAQGARFAMREGQTVTLSGWIQGSPLVMDDAEPHLRLAVEALAHFHIASVGFQPPAGVAPRGALDGVPGRMEAGLATLRRWRERRPSSLESPGALDRMIAQGEAALDRLRASHYRAWVAEVAAGGGMLAHGLYRKGNALAMDDGAYILDLEHVAYGLPIEDLRAVILGWFRTQGRWVGDELRAILDRYSAQFPLSPAQRAVLRADLLFPHGFLEAAHRTLATPPEETPPDLAAVVALEEEKGRMLVEWGHG
jgi:spore coat protein I